MVTLITDPSQPGSPSSPLMQVLYAVDIPPPQVTEHCPDGPYALQYAQTCLLKILNHDAFKNKMN